MINRIILLLITLMVNTITATIAHPIHCEFAQNTYLTAAGNIALSAHNLVAHHLQEASTLIQLKKLQQELQKEESTNSADVARAQANTYCQQQLQLLHKLLQESITKITQHASMAATKQLLAKLARIGHELTMTRLTYTVEAAVPSYNVGAKPDEARICLSHIGTTIPALMGGMQLKNPAAKKHKVLED